MLGRSSFIPVELHSNGTTDHYKAEFMYRVKPDKTATKQLSQQFNVAIRRAREDMRGKIFLLLLVSASPSSLSRAGGDGIPAYKPTPAPTR